MTSVEISIRDKSFKFETGQIARQASGSTVLKYGDTFVLATAVASKTAREGIDFFPLTIDYLEKTYSAGKIPGGFFKREGRMSEKEILTILKDRFEKTHHVPTQWLKEEEKLKIEAFDQLPQQFQDLLKKRNIENGYRTVS